VVSDHGAFDAQAEYPPFVAAAIRTPCAKDPDLFTAYEDRGRNRARRIAKARAVCAPCPLRAACEDWATQNHQTGIWGGTDEFERAMTRRRAANLEVRRAALRAA
jgi:hypothetical protein